MTNFACMDNMFDFDQQTVGKGCFVDQTDLMAWFDQSPLIMPDQHEERGYNGLFTSCFLETTTSPSMELKETQNLLLHEQEQEEEGSRLSPTTAAATSPTQQTAHLHDHVPKYKKRKNQQKRVVQQVKAEDVSSDLWAWRKYGQKPIKGSSFPRSYYRCSSSKGCIARKLVERSNSDPGMFIVTYTGDHTHSHPTRRSSLAGSTRTSTKTPSPSTTRPKQQTLAEEVAAEQQLLPNNTNQIQDLVFSEEIDEMVMGWGELDMADQWPWILP